MQIRFLAVHAAALVLASLFLGVAQPAFGADEKLAVPTAQLARRPLEQFARLPRLSGVALSPDGRQLAMLLSEGGHTGVVTRPAGRGGALKLALGTDNLKFRFNWVRWVNNERLLVSLRYPSRRGFVGTTETRLVSLKPDGSEQLPLQRDEAASSRGSRGGSQQIQDEVIDWLPQDGRHVLVQMAEAGRAAPAVFRINVEDGSRSVVQAPEKDVLDWLTDKQHRVRVGLRDNLNGSHELIARDAPGAPWRTLWKFNRAADAVWPLGFGADPQELFVRAVHQGRLAVFSVRLDDPALPRQLRLADPHADVEGSLLVAPGSGEVLGLRSAVAGDGEARSELWSAPWRALAEMLDRALPGQQTRLLDISHDGRRYVAYASGNGKPGRYYLGDRQSGELVLIDHTYPELAAAPLVGKQAATIQARDGLPLRAYLTLPAGRGAQAERPRLPLVLLPHGGPASRDDDDFDPWTEFLADRGYAVLQVNFRGSDGYGPAFKEAGLRRWGLEMQDDLTDAVRWAVAQGLADPGRVCIVGASYGGYAALMGAVKTPELYRCAVSFAGVSDLPDLIAHQTDYFGGQQATERMLGDAWKDRERLRATSPALQAERIRAPVLLVHGTADRVVPVAQSQGMARALRSAGKTHRYVEQDDGDHHLGRQADRLQFFRELETFLDRHLAAP